MSKTSDQQRELRDPFPESDIKWRVQQSAIYPNGGGWALVIPYITSRAIQDRLDDVLGIDGWEDVYRETPRGMLCGITAHFESRSVTKWDGAAIPRELTQEEIKKGKTETIDPVKTVLSTSEKRTGSKFGIGRYLYNLEPAFVVCKNIGSRNDLSDGAIYMKKKSDKIDFHLEWYPPLLEPWALPSVKFEALINEIDEAENFILLRAAYVSAYKYARSFGRSDYMKKAVEAKEAQEQKLKIETKEENTQQETTIRAWLERTITDRILEVENESVLRLSKGAISKELNEKTLEAGIDNIELLQVLEGYCQRELIRLKTGA